LLWSTFYDSYQQTQHVNFTCECGAWRMPWKLDPIEAFRGRVLDLPGRSIGVEVLKAGINAGREYQCHLDKAQVDVILWGGGVLP
jgi:hypothetical protein